MMIHFAYSDGSNPYIAKTYAALFNMVRKYNLRQVWNNQFIVESTRKSKPTYDETKQILRDFAIMWQHRFDKVSWSYEDIANYEGFFRTYGKKYGLLREFRENGIC